MTLDPTSTASVQPAEHIRRVAFVFLALLVGLAVRLAAHGLIQPGNGTFSFINAHCVWDCEFYSSIIENGYDLEVGSQGQPARANWAFFPLYPLLASIPVRLFGLSPAMTGFLLSNALIAMAAFLARDFFQSKTAYLFFLATLLVGPFSILFSSLYTESLFILLTTLALMALRRSRYLQAGIWVALLSATRVTGVLMVFGMLAQVISDHRRSGGTWSALPRRVLGDSKLVLAFLIAPLGLFAYMAFLYVQTGDALAFSHIQRGWNRGFDLPLAAIVDAFAGGWRLEYNSLLQKSWAIAGIIGLALSAILAMRGRYAEAVFCALCLLVSLSSGIGSMVRFTAGLVPLGMIASELLTRWRWLGWTALAAAIALDAIISIGWFNKSMFVM